MAGKYKICKVSVCVIGVKECHVGFRLHLNMLIFMIYFKPFYCHPHFVTYFTLLSGDTM